MTGRSDRAANIYVLQVPRQGLDMCELTGFFWQLGQGLSTFYRGTNGGSERLSNIAQSHLPVKGASRPSLPRAVHLGPLPQGLSQQLTHCVVLFFLFNLWLLARSWAVSAALTVLALAPGTVPGSQWVLNNAEEWRKRSLASSQ